MTAYAQGNKRISWELNHGIHCIGVFNKRLKLCNGRQALGLRQINSLTSIPFIIEYMPRTCFACDMGSSAIVFLCFMRR